MTHPYGLCRFRVNAYAAGGQRLASKPIWADAADTALHEMAEEFPQAVAFNATPICEETDSHASGLDT